ncbi:Stk1 family PASTA domain-containing Ser/Thr kinase [Priestia koreensis]|uniref:Serine/threonine-protein kinase PrkC n=1 Tax=Priestia koreensis TaxID=284581 RepID=A0A0M0KPE3_9BACI|nr:Stk1 family PASTA domain-containing Ser/Thr kinase [Priestia koreensis]KOO40694.1 serine/threonine protein kinase [Priestia koreensis]
MLIGRRLNDRYKIVKVIGGGGMANVYLARDIILERDVAIKVLRLDFSNDESFIKRFHREAQSATSIAHPNIVSIYDVGEQEDIYYIVMEYVPGQTLKQYIQREAPVPIDTALNIMAQITEAINHAHEFSIVHRDIKPQNILIDDHGTAKVADFGIALALSSTTITQTSSVLGSVHYLSPEQARGGMANKRSDIYSLGIVLFELLTGRVPFSGESAVAIALKHLQTETPSPKRWNPSIPQSVENIVLKATAKDPFYRYETAAEMLEDLKSALYPERLNEQKFRIPVDEDATKAIPVIKDTVIQEESDETIVTPPKKGKKAASISKTPPVKEKKRKKKKKSRLLPTLIILFVLLIGAGVAAVTLVPSLLLPKDIQVPNLADTEYEDAVNQLSSLGFSVGDPKLVTDDKVEEGKVVRTDPESGEVAKEGSKVTIYQSTGKKKFTIGDYKGRDIEGIKPLLSEFRSMKTFEVSGEESPGTIVDQDPRPDEEVIPDETDITFWVSTGPPEIPVKDLMGWTEKSVRDYANDVGANLDIQKEYSKDEEKGLVIKQSPSKGTNIQKGQTIHVKISEGEKPKPPKKVTVDVTIPYETVTPGEPQQVKIFVDDKDHDMDMPVQEFPITAPMTKKIDLIIPQGETATYRIIRDEQVIEEKQVNYPEQ